MAVGRPYSERFVAHWNNNPSPIYTVPAGKRAVIKCIVGANNNTTPGVVGITVNGVQVWNVKIQASDGVTASGLMLVLYPGDKLAIEHQFPYMLSAACGYLLDNPAA
jgi:hypothetical protein